MAQITDNGSQIKIVDTNTLITLPKNEVTTSVAGNNVLFKIGNFLHYTALYTNVTVPVCTSAQNLKDIVDGYISAGVPYAQTSNVASPAYPSNTIVLLGDSWIQQHLGVNLGSDCEYRDVGFFNWANIRLRKRFNIIGIKGIGGQTLSQIAARFSTDVVALSPKYVLIEGGINDALAAASIDPSASITALQSMYAQAKAAGIVVIDFATPMVAVLSNATKKGYACNLNRWRSQNARVSDNIIYVDINQQELDPSTGFILAAHIQSDLTHPNPLGGTFMGEYVYSVLDPLIPKIENLVVCNDDPNNFLANGMVTGNSSGLATPDWNTPTVTSGTITPSKVAKASPLNGDWQQFVCTSVVGGSVRAGASHAPNVTYNGGAIYQIGDVLVFDMEFETDAAGYAFTKITPNLFFNGSNLASSDFTHLSNNSQGTATTKQLISGVFRGVPMTVPPATTNFIFQLSLEGSGTIRIGKVSVRKANSYVVNGNTIYY